MVIATRRLWALCRKETYQIIRDPSSWLIAVLIPILLLVIFGYGTNLDATRINVGVVVPQQSEPAQRFLQTLRGSPFITIKQLTTEIEPLKQAISRSEIRAMIVLPSDFAQRYAENSANIQLITDGSEPNTAHFVQAYLQGVLQIWQQQTQQDLGQSSANSADISLRYWFNAAAISRRFIIPGAITIIMTVICSILTSLVIAREWERGTMESLLATPMTKWELLLSKLLPYYVLGLIALVICMLFALWVLQVPYRGSWILLFVLSSLFLFSVLGMGLLISTITRNQFNAAMVALNAAFLPAVMLSGFVFEVSSMPAIIRAITYIIPAKYFVSTLQTLFLAGDMMWVLIINGIFLLSFTLLMMGLVLYKTRLHLD
ncbi:ABC transporter permease [Utexia brackfieldae]|uniref:ABC transporter permease n=1 Tax=Utexia brackfieldae TaxID=3074108 RepID=UPI00370DA8A0